MLRYLRSHRPRHLRLLALLALLACGGTTVAYGYLTATSQQGDTVPTVVARSLDKPSTAPSASVAGSTITVTLTQDSVADKRLGEYTGGGYRVQRHTWDGTTIGSGATPSAGTCKDVQSGATATLICTDTSAPAGGTYQYTAIPVLNNFTGPASDPSATVTIAAPAVAPTVTMDPVATPTKNKRPSFTGTASTNTGDLSKITVRVYSGTTTSTLVQTVETTASGGNWSVAPSSDLADGTYTAQASQSNLAGLTGTSEARTFRVDATAPTVTGIKGVNGGTSAAGIVGIGDSLEYVFSEEIRKTTVLSSWTGATASVVVRVNDAGGNGNQDTVQVLISGNPIATLGTVDTKGDYVSAATSFNATLSQTENTIKVAFDSLASGSAPTKVVGAKQMTWTFSAGMTDLAGNALPAGTFAAPSVVNF